MNKRKFTEYNILINSTALINQELRQLSEKFLKLKRDFKEKSLSDNIRIDGLKEYEKETWEETEAQFQEFFRTNLI